MGYLGNLERSVLGQVSSIRGREIGTEGNEGNEVGAGGRWRATATELLLAVETPGTLIRANLR